MMKKKILAILLAGLLLVLAGCTGNKTQTDAPAGDVDGIFSNFSNEELSIYNKDHEVIGSISHFGGLIQTEDSIIYTAVPDSSTNLPAEVEYYRYNLSGGETVKLGSVKDWFQPSSEAVVLRNQVYMLVETGDHFDKPSQMLKLVKIDLATNSMEEVFSEKGGSSYESMVGTGNKLLITRVLEDGSRVDEYDPETGSMKTVKSFGFEDTATAGEAIRQIAIDGDTVSLMMLVKESSGPVKLRMDTYDDHWNLKKSVDVSKIALESDERKQGISNFECNEQFFYYENYGTVRFLGKAGEKLQSILDTNGPFAMASESEFIPPNKLFYQAYDASNAIYLLDSKTGERKKSEFFADEKEYYITHMSRDADGDLLIGMLYNGPEPREQHPARLYYINLDDLNFQTMD